MTSLSFRKILPPAVAVGILVGLFGVAFLFVWHLISDRLWEAFPDPVNRIWISTAAGALIAVCIKLFWDPGTMSDLLHHFHQNGRLGSADNKPIIPISMIGLIGGSSAGPEGVLTQVGGSIGSWISARFKRVKQERILTQAGMGAGFGAFLGAPVGGGILWLEMPHRKGMEYFESLIPTLICSLAGYIVMAAILHVHLMPSWNLGPFTTSAFADLEWAFGIGLMSAGLAFIYAYLFRATGRIFRASRIPVWILPVVAGFIIGVLGYYVPLTYFYGFNEINSLVTDASPVLVLVTLLFGKMLAASVTIQGRWQGGLIVPNMFMGAVVGKIIAALVPGVPLPLLMAAGMAAFNSAATQTPLASALIVIALGGFGGTVPVFLASLTAFIAGQRVELIRNKVSRIPLQPLEGAQDRAA